MDTKICNKCKLEKPISEFYKRNGRPLGLMSRCKKCENLCHFDYVQKNREKVYKKKKEWNKNNPNKVKKWDFEKGIKYRYGLSIDKYNEMLNDQNNKCAICNENFTHKNKPCIDHNHEDLKVRALLCRKCNALIGLSNENIIILYNSIKYLEKYNGK